MKTVLYINGKLGVWMGFKGETCINVHAEPLRVGQAAYKPCEWLRSKQQFVHLVIDSEHTECEAYPLQPDGTFMRQLSHKKALRKTLIDRFPDSIIQTPIKSTGLDALLVQKLKLSKLCRNWLAYVEKSAITFCSVASSTEIVASMFDSSDRPCLVLCNVPGYCKHTLCVSGHALFTRTLEHTENFSVIGGLEETLSHLRATELIDSAVRVYLVGLSDQQLIGACALEWVSELVRCNETLPLAVGEHHKLDDLAMQHGAIFRITQHVIKQGALQQHGSKRYVSLVLTKHLKFIKHRQSRLQLAVFCALTVSSAVYSGSKHVDKQQRQSNYKQTKARLLLEIDNTRRAVLDESPDGIVLSKALFDAQALKTSAGPDPAILLPMIATVFTEHRELVLQELNWITIDNKAADSEVAGNVAAEPSRTAIASTDRITSRHRISTEYQPVSKLLVNVMAISHSAETLREQQSALNAVVSRLNSYSSVSNLVVLEAPLSNVANNNRIGADALDLATRFRIQFEVDKS